MHIVHVWDISGKAFAEFRGKNGSYGRLKWFLEMENGKDKNTDVYAQNTGRRSVPELTLTLSFVLLLMW